MTPEGRDHLSWCRQRAFEYLEEGDAKSAAASFLSDVSKHSDTANLMTQAKAADLALVMLKGDVFLVRRWIEAFGE